MKTNQADYPVRAMCRVLGLSPSGYYAWVNRPPSARAKRDAELVLKIRKAYNEYRQVPTGDDRVNTSADVKLDPTIGAWLPPSQLLLFLEVLRQPLEFTQYTSIAFGLRCR